MVNIPSINAWSNFANAETMYRRHIKDRKITFDKTIWMDWNEKVKMSILVIKFLKTYYCEYDKIHSKYAFILKNSFSIKGKSIEIREIKSAGCIFTTGYEFHLSTFWNYEIGVGAQNTRSGKFDLYSKAVNWYIDFVDKMCDNIGDQAAQAILNQYKSLSAATEITSV